MTVYPVLSRRTAAHHSPFYRCQPPRGKFSALIAGIVERAILQESHLEQATIPEKQR